MDGASILPVIKSHDNKNICNASYIPLIPWLQADLEKMSFARDSKIFLSTTRVIAMIKDWGEIRTIQLPLPCVTN